MAFTLRKIASSAVFCWCLVVCTIFRALGTVRCGQGEMGWSLPSPSDFGSSIWKVCSIKCPFTSTCLPPSNFQTFLRPCMLPLARLKELLDHICILFRSRDHSLFGVIFGTLNHYKVPVAPAVTSLIENRFLVDFLNMNKIILHKSFKLIVVWSACPTDFPCHHYFLNCVVFSIF